MKRRALMLARENKEILELFENNLKRRATVNAQLDELQAKAEELSKFARQAENDDIKTLEGIVKDLGIKVFDKKHQLAFDPEEGVVWLESEQDCNCMQCQIGKIFKGLR